MDINNLSPDQLMAQSKEENCKSCGSGFFQEVLMFRRLSRLFTGAPQDSLIPFPVYRCADCYTPLGNKPEEEPTAPTESKIIKM